jgi:hypothetical protein
MELDTLQELNNFLSLSGKPNEQNPLTQSLQTDLTSSILASKTNHNLLTLPLDIEVYSPLPQALASNEDALIGIIDTGFIVNPDSNFTQDYLLGSDRLEQDFNPLLPPDSNNSHGTQVLEIIAPYVEDSTPIWLSRAVGSGNWAASLEEFVNKKQELGSSRAVINLSFDLTEIDATGKVSTRNQLTRAEYAALSYAQEHQVIIVTAAGNTSTEISALGQASANFDNIITVGAAATSERAPYSSYGDSLTLVAPGSLPQSDLEGTSLAAAQVTAAISQTWAANPNLDYSQVIDIVKTSAQDLGISGWDTETGFGLLDVKKALELAIETPLKQNSSQRQRIWWESEVTLEQNFWQSSLDSIPSEREAGILDPAINWVRERLNGAFSTMWGFYNSAVSSINNLPSYDSIINNLTSNLSSLYDKYLKSPVEAAFAELNQLDLENAFRNIIAQGEAGLNSLYSKFFAEPIEQAKGKINGLANPSQLLAQGQKSLGDVTKIFDPLVKSIKSEIDNFKGLADQVIAPFTKLVGSPDDLVDKPKDIWESLKKFINLQKDLLLNPSQSLDKLTKVFADKNGIFSNISGQLEQIKSSFNSTIAGLDKDLGEQWEKASQDAFDQFNNFLFQGLNDKFAAAQTIINRPRDLIVNPIDLINEANSLWQDTKNTINFWHGQANSIIDRARNSINHVRGVDVENILRDFGNFKVENTIQETISKPVTEKICKNLPWPFGLACETITKIVTETITKTVNVSANTIPRFSGVIDSIIRDSIHAPFSAVTSNLDGLVNKSINSVISALDTLNNINPNSYIDSAKNRAFKELNALNSSFNNVWAKADISSIRAKVDNGDFVKQAWDTAQSAVNPLKTLQKVAGDAADIFKPLGNQLKTSFEKAKGDIKQFNLPDFKAVNSKLFGALNPLFDKFKTTTTPKILNNWQNLPDIGKKLSSSLTTIKSIPTEIDKLLQGSSIGQNFLPIKSYFTSVGDWLEKSIITPIVGEISKQLGKIAKPISLSSLGLNLGEKMLLPYLKKNGKT